MSDFNFAYDAASGGVDVELPDSFTGEELNEILEFVERKVIERMVDDALCPMPDDAFGDEGDDMNDWGAFSCTLRGIAATLCDEVSYHYERYEFFRADAEDLEPLEEAETVTVFHLLDEPWFAIERNDD